MATIEPTENSNGTSSLSEQIRFFLSEHRVAGYLIGSILGIWLLGYAVDLAAGPLTDSTELAHTISGLLGAMAIVLVICAVAVGLLWGGLMITGRRKRDET